LAPIQKNSRIDIEALLREADKEVKKNIMRAQTLTRSNKDSEDSPGGDWADLPDPTEKKNVKLSKKQRVFEAEIISTMLKNWDEIFRIAVEKKGRKIILSKDEYSIDYNIKNRRELILPPEYYLNLTKLERHFVENYQGKAGVKWQVGDVRMYLDRRYEIKSDLIHLSNISKFWKVHMVDLVRKRYKPYQNKLLMKVKKRIKLRHAKKIVTVTKNMKRLTQDKIDMLPSHGKKASEVLKILKKEEDAPKSQVSNEDDKYSNISDHENTQRTSILNVVEIANKKNLNLNEAFKTFSKANKQGKGYMNIHMFSSFLGVALEIRLTSVNKRGLFWVLDTNKDGYVDEGDFVKIFSITKEDIEKASEDPYNYREGEILYFIILQIYYDIIFFKSEGLQTINSKLDENGMISMKKLEQYLSFYKVILTDLEKSVLSGTEEENELTGQKLVPFKRLLESTMIKNNLKVEFKVNFARMETYIPKNFDRKERLDFMEKYYEEEQRK
jgi:Ca2+-binding EF-hand superfamily protein